MGGCVGRSVSWLVSQSGSHSVRNKDLLKVHRAFTSNSWLRFEFCKNNNQINIHEANW